jgi:two-component system sensor histidine kinase UhpB
MRLQQTQELTHVGSWEWLLDSDELTWSQEHFNIFGLAAEQYHPCRETAFDHVHPADVARLKEQIRTAIDARTAFSCGFRMVRPDGSERMVISRGNWAPGQARRMFGTTQDVTQLKQAQADLLAANRRTHALAGTIKAQEGERRHIARELHDDIGQALTAITIRLHRLKRRPHSEQSVAELDKCIQIAARSLEQVRSLSLSLRPPHLDDLGLEAAIAWLLDQQCEGADLAHSFMVRPLPREVPDDVAVACFRVAQEALTNIIRHAGAAHVRAELSGTDQRLCFSIADDGRGFDYPAAQVASDRGVSMGLIGMQERAALLGGNLEVRSTPLKGTRLTVYLPLIKPEKTPHDE